MSRTTPVLLVAFLLPALAPAAPPPIETRTLPNGLTVLVAESHALPLVTIEIAVKNGSMTEPPEYNGLSHLYEHMFFKANAVIPNQEAYLARARELGMLLDGTTNTERVNYFFTTTTAHFDDAMVFMRDAIVSPLFDPKEFEKERVVVTGEIDRAESNPRYHFFHEVQKKVWWKYPTYKDPLGSRAAVLAATTDMMRTIQKRYYVPNNSVLVVTGDVRAADVFRKAASLYAGWKRAEDPFVKLPLVRHPPVPRTEVVLVEQPVQTVSLSMTWHGPSTVGPDVASTYPADLLGYAVLLPSSKFQKSLVDSGACVRASFSWLTQMNTGPVTLTAETTPEKADVCLKAALAELPRMKQPDYLSDEEMANAGQALELDFAREREKPSTYAHAITFWWTSAGLDYYRAYVDNVKRATRQDIARFLDGYVLGKPFVLGALVSPAMVKDKGLDRAHFEMPLAAPEVAATAPAPPTAVAVEGEVTAYDLNGMEILVKRVRGAEFVASHLYVKGGVRNWGADDAGVERLALATAASGGTERQDKDSFLRRLETMGSTLGASSVNDFGSLVAKSLKARFPETFRMMADAFLSPALPAAEIEVERQRMLAALRREEDDPDGRLGRLVEKTLFTGHLYANRAAGSAGSVSSLTREKAAAHLAKLRETTRLLLVVVGDVEAEAVFGMARRAFGSLPRGSFSAAPLPPLKFDKPRLVTESRKLPTNYILSAFAVPGPRDPDHVAARVAMRILGFREFEEVRTKRNLSYAPRAWMESGGVSYGVLYVTATDPAATMKVMFGEARRLGAKAVPEKELAGTKEEYLSGYLAASESTDGQAEQLALAQLLAGDFREARRFLDKIRAVTPGDVKKFAQVHICNLQTSLLGDPASFGNGLELSP